MMTGQFVEFDLGGKRETAKVVKVSVNTVWVRVLYESSEPVKTKVWTTPPDGSRPYQVYKATGEVRQFSGDKLIKRHVKKHHVVEVTP